MLMWLITFFLIAIALLIIFLESKQYETYVIIKDCIIIVVLVVLFLLFARMLVEIGYHLIGGMIWTIF